MTLILTLVLLVWIGYLTWRMHLAGMLGEPKK